MIHPIPSGTRDVLPDETREVRAITDTLRGVFERHGYGEVYTPALEYESVLARADMAEAKPAYRVFDETGAVLVLRSDMTVPIARVVATRYASSEPPLRFCYFAHCYRGVRPQRGQPRELLQAGIELIGAPAPQGTAEALTVLCHALDATGLKDYRIGLGDASLFPALMASLDVPEPARPGLLEALVLRDFVGLERALAQSGLSGEAAELLLEVPQRRGGPEVLADTPAQARGGGHRPAARPRAARARRGRARDLRPRPRAQHRLLHRSGVRGLRPGVRRADRWRWPLRRPARALRPPRFRLSASRWSVDRLHMALAGEERGTGALLARAADQDAT